MNKVFEIVITMIAVLCIGFTSFAANENQGRWLQVRQYSDSDFWLDTQTIEYSPQTDTVKYWIKSSDSHYTFLNQETVDYQNRRVRGNYSIWYLNGSKVRENAGTNRWNAILPDDIHEHTANMVADLIGHAHVFPTDTHTWKLIYAPHVYICTDLYQVNKRWGTCLIYIKDDEDSSADDVYDMIVDFNTHMIKFSDGSGAAIAAPDTKEEAIYDAAMKLARIKA